MAVNRLLATILTIVLLPLFMACKDGEPKSIDETEAEAETEAISIETTYDIPEVAHRFRNAPSVAKEFIGPIHLGQSVDDVRAELGEPEEEVEFELWAADDCEHGSWTYRSRGIRVELVREKDGSTISETITLMAPCELETARGVKIGTDRSTVEKVYYDVILSTPEEEDEPVIATGTEMGGVIFFFENGLVTEITAGAAADL